MGTTSRPESANITIQPEPQDLGLGSVIGRAHEKRLLNRDGSFNQRRRGLSYFKSLSAYQSLLTLSWTRFFGLILLSYVTASAVFAGIFMLLGPAALRAQGLSETQSLFLQDFFFSVHTLATIGFGTVVPASLSADIVVSVESLVGLMGLALWTGLLFSRFSRPIAALIFSQNAVVAPYRDYKAFMFRVVNGRSNQMVELKATVLFSRIVDGVRRYDNLVLERSGVVFFPLSWTVVHPIDAKSPMFGLSRDELDQTEAEVLILISGIDETFAQTVHARSSYKPSEVMFGYKFSNIYEPLEDGIPSIDVRRLSEVERAT
jgi:inward rectifier potassium channel